ncbi:MAG: hypothetical protein R2752_09475 [Vicinamibacterales bacterium]
MTEARIGRVVAACLDQAIADELPLRRDFYEHWLRSETLRDGAIGQAPLTAVLGFLRTEGEGCGRVMARAGTLAASWSLDSKSAGRLRLLRWLPRPLRLRAAMRLLRGVVRETSGASRATARIRRQEARIEVADSLFCASRERPPSPLCAFYLAAAVEVLRRLGFAAEGRVERCHAIERGACVLTLQLTAAAVAPDPAMAA